MLLSTIILVGLPACCGSKKNNAKAKTEHEVTLNNEVDSLSIQLVDEQSATTTHEDNAVITEHEDIVPEADNKF